MIVRLPGQFLLVTGRDGVSWVNALLAKACEGSSVLPGYHPSDVTAGQGTNVPAATLPRLDLASVLREPCAGLRVRQGADLGETILEIDGTIDPDTARQLEDRIWEHFDAWHQHLRYLSPEQFGDFTDGVLGRHHSDPLALVQLLPVHRILGVSRSALLEVPLGVEADAIAASRPQGTPFVTTDMTGPAAARQAARGRSVAVLVRGGGS